MDENLADKDGMKTKTSEEFIKLFLSTRKINNLRIIGGVEITEDHGFNLQSSEITNCEFKDEVIFKTKAAVSTLLLVKCVFKKRLVLFHSDFQKIKLARCTFAQYFAFKQIKATRLIIEECIINNTRELKLQEFQSTDFVFAKNESDNAVQIKPISVTNLYLEGSEKAAQLTFSFLNNAAVIKRVTIVNAANYLTDYTLRNFSARLLILSGVLKGGSIFINNLQAETAVCDYFFNQGDLKLSTFGPLNGESTLAVKNSSLGNAQINNCNFFDFKRVAMSGSSILDIVPVNVLWCTHKNILDTNTEVLKENYRQLKLIAVKSEDIDNKLLFEKQEMHTFLKIISRSKGKVIDKFILYTNYYSNDFGLNWAKAFSWLLTISIISYTCIKALIGQTEFDSSLILEDIGKFLLFINPIHQFDKIFGIDHGQSFTHGAVFFDGLSRILGAYFIYQFISAFRKYSKK